MFQLVVQPCAATEGADPAVSLFCCSTFPQGGKLFFHLCDSTEKIDEDRRYDKIDIRHKLSDPMAIGPMQYLYHEFHVMNDFE